MTARAVPGASDREIVERVLAGDVAAYELIMRRHNQRLYRAARAILRDDAEAEDVLQDAYVRAYQHLGDFGGEAQFSTWLTRIAVNEALTRLKRRQRTADLATAAEPGKQNMDSFKSQNPSPEQQLLASEARDLLETAIDALPGGYRVVFVMREVEELSTAETAACLDMTEENVKVRLHRAKRLLRHAITERVGSASAGAFQFMAARCDRVVRAAMDRIAQLSTPTPATHNIPNQ